MRKNKVILLITCFAVALFGLIAFAPASFASTYDVNVNSIRISPSEPTVGETIEIDVDFTVVTADSSNRVELYLYIDGEEAKSHTGSYSDGDHSYEFEYDTSDLEIAAHTVKIKANLLSSSGGSIKDTDTLTEGFEVVRGTAKKVHDIEIASVSKSAVAPSSTGEVSVTVKNVGNAQENSIRVSLQVNGTTVQSSYFGLAGNEQITMELSFTAPATDGTYDMIVKAVSPNDADLVTDYLIVGVGQFDLKLSSYDIQAGSWLRVWGSATVGNSAADKVKIYKDGVYVTTASPESSGYFSEWVQMLQPGWHTISAAVGNTEKSWSVKVEPSEATSTTGWLSDDEKTSITASFSTTSLDAVSGKGNLLYVNLKNSLSKAIEISITTDFSSAWAIVPPATTIQAGETETLPIYFAPPSAGTFSGTISINAGSQLISEHAISIYAVKQESVPAIKSIGDIGFAGYVFLGGLFFAILAMFVIAHAGWKVPRMSKRMPLEPLGISSTSALQRALQRRLPSEGQKIFFVPRDRIIY